MGIALVLALTAVASCKRKATRDAGPPPPGTARGSFALTYYWVTPGSGENVVGVKDQPLVPYRSVAVDPKVIPLGTHLYLRELDGAALPGGGTHDGCALAMDVGGKIKGDKIDWFVEAKANYRDLDDRLKLTHVTVHDGGMRCR